MAGWIMSRGEHLVLGVSLEPELHDDAKLTGTPVVSVWEKTGSGEADWTDRTNDFTIANPQVTAAETTDQKGRTIPIGAGVLFELTAAEDEGDYKVRVECEADDQTHPVTVRDLKVIGPGTPA